MAAAILAVRDGGSGVTGGLRRGLMWDADEDLWWLVLGGGMFTLILWLGRSLG